MPFDGGVITGALAALAFKKFKDHKRKKNERERDRPQNIYISPDSSNTTSKSNASKQAHLDAKLDEVNTMLLTAMTAMLAPPPAYVTNLYNMTNVGMGTTPADPVWHNLYQQLQTLNPRFTNMGEGKRGVEVPQSPLRTQPQFKRPGMAGSQRNGPPPPPPPYPPPPYERRT